MAFALAVVASAFWVDDVLARPVADVRPMFARLPLLFVGFVAGMVFVLERPARSWAWLAALVLTLALPMAMSFGGDLEWPAVAAGYLGVSLVVATYAGIRACVVARAPDRLTGGVVTAVACLGFHSNDERWLTLARGVIDVRDIVFYASVAGLFWALAWVMRRPHRSEIAKLLGVVVGLVAINVLLAPSTAWRLDTTRGARQTLSAATVEVLEQLDRDVRIQVVVSADPHPGLAALMPRVRDVLTEFTVMSRRRVSVRYVVADGRRALGLLDDYGIAARPPLPDASPDYFAIVVEIGERHRLLDITELVIRRKTSTGFELSLRNLEYSVASAIAQLAQTSPSIRELLLRLATPVTLTLYKSPGGTPEKLDAFHKRVALVGRRLQAGNRARFTYAEIVVSSAAAEKPLLDWGVRPLQVATDRAAYFHPVLRVGDSPPRLIAPDAKLGRATIRRMIATELRRSIRATRTVGLAGSGLAGLSAQLERSYRVVRVDLTKPIPKPVDVIIVGGRDALDATAVRGLDAALVAGKAVIAFASGRHVRTDGGLHLVASDRHLLDALRGYGVEVASDVVLDERSLRLRFPVIQAGGDKAKLYELDYPMFVRVPAQDVHTAAPFARELDSVVVPWASVVTTSSGVVLWRASPNARRELAPRATPDMKQFPTRGFPASSATEATSFGLAALARGPFGDGASADARLLVIAAADFVSDAFLLSARQLAVDKGYLNNVAYVLAAIDWALDGGHWLAVAEARRAPSLTVESPLGYQLGTLGILLGLALLLVGWRKLIVGRILRG